MKNSAFFTLCAIALLYLICLPVSVQNLDSGEIVGNAFAFNVLHPPGYPLLTLLFGAFTNTFGFSTVFFRAAFLNAIFALLTLGGVFYLARRVVVLAIALTCSLACMPAFWHYAVIPDVFMLHALLTAAFIVVYFSFARSHLKLYLMAIIFGLGSANHLTIIFCLPMLLEEYLYFGQLRAVLISGIVGIAITFALYLSLFSFHTAALYSWGEVDQLTALWHHFARSEFGTFQLSGHSDSSGGWTNILTFFTRVTTGIPLGLLAVAVAIMVGKGDRRFYVAIVCSALYVFIFLPVANVVTPEVIERFIVMPAVMLILLSAAMVAAVAEKIMRWRWVAGFIGAAIAILNLQQNFRQLNMSHNTIIEDYARNLLLQSDPRRQALYFVDGDSRLFPMRYLQIAEKLRPNAVVLSTGLAFYEPMLRKVHARFPDFEFKNVQATDAQSRDIVERLMKPNLAKFDVFSTARVSLGDLQTTYLALGRKFSIGQGQILDLNSLGQIQLHSNATLFSPSLQPSEQKALFAEYAFIYLKAGSAELDPARSIDWFEKALKIVPYCIPAAKNICIMKSRLQQPVEDCEKNVESLTRTEFNYF